MISDGLLKQAIDYCEINKGCSLKGLMEKFNLGFNKGSILLDVLEAEGIVEAFDGDLFRKFLNRGYDVFTRRNF